MESGQLAELTPKARQTRETILNAALTLFATKGYQETTLRDIAAAADCSLGLTYRYFARKEELVLALYMRLTRELQEEAAVLPPGSLAVRFSQTLRADLARLAPHRNTLGALFGVGLEPNSEVAVLGERISEIRRLIWQVFLDVCLGATDKIKPRQAEQLATLFYAVHLSVILFWLQDRSPDQGTTTELIEFMQEMLGRLRPFLGVPLVTRSLTRLARILTPMFGPGPAQ